MARRPRDPTAGVFVTRDTLAIRCEMSVDTVDQWVRDGFLPPPIERGQIKRWHWPTVESVLLASQESQVAHDPYMTGVNRNAKSADRRSP